MWKTKPFYLFIYFTYEHLLSISLVLDVRNRILNNNKNLSSELWCVAEYRHANKKLYVVISAAMGIRRKVT